MNIDESTESAPRSRYSPASLPVFLTNDSQQGRFQLNVVTSVRRKLCGVPCVASDVLLLHLGSERDFDFYSHLSHADPERLREPCRDACVHARASPDPCVVTGEGYV